MDNDLQHYGVKRRSGRYPWGSGEDPYQSADSVLTRIGELREQGLTEVEIAKDLGFESTKQLRQQIAIMNDNRKKYLHSEVNRLYDEGYGPTEIGKRLGISEGSARNYRKTKLDEGKTKLDNTKDQISKRLEEIDYLDVGPGVDKQMGISKGMLDNAVAQLIEEGYYQHKLYIPDTNNPDKWRTLNVLTKEKDREVAKLHTQDVKSMESYSEDGGLGYLKINPPTAKNLISKDRIKIVYSEDGGSDKDGLIELRAGSEDLNLGGSRYAQVRIGVEGRKYLKGMAMEVDGMPKGTDVIFYTNKKKGTPVDDVLKDMKDSKDNPFGATISRQKGNVYIVNEEGSWGNWSAKFSSQFLSKQSASFVKDRLDATWDDIQKEYDEINALTNPTVKKHLMKQFADGLETKASTLAAKSVNRTASHVLLPDPDINPNEIFAPNYKNGDTVVLVRHPHGGIFEIPELKVNNKTAKHKKLLDAPDAVVIHPSVAAKLSGADFDGDTVLVIPNNNRKIKTARSLKELKNFDPGSYKNPPDTKKMSDKTKQLQMGNVSNLITDMTIKGATDSEIARAVRHSMVVIDAQKHNLNWQQSAKDNGIQALKNKYQAKTTATGRKSTGASTIVSRSSSERDNPNYGNKLWDGSQDFRKTVPLMSMVSDANTLSSGTAVEKLYSDYANKAKALMNTSRKQTLSTRAIPYSPAAKKKYAPQVKTLDQKLDVAVLNKPRERRAQAIANDTFWKNYDKSMSKDDVKKLRSQALAGARSKTEAQKVSIYIDDDEWTAIQAGAVSKTKLNDILNNADMDRVKMLATPKPKSTVSSAKLQRAHAMRANGYTIAEIAEQLGVSTTTIQNELR